MVAGHTAIETEAAPPAYFDGHTALVRGAYRLCVKLTNTFGSTRAIRSGFWAIDEDFYLRLGQPVLGRGAVLVDHQLKEICFHHSNDLYYEVYVPV